MLEHELKMQQMRELAAMEQQLKNQYNGQTLENEIQRQVIQAARKDCLEPQGIKHDQEKPDYSLLSPIALNQIVEVLTYGKTKYTAHNWRRGFQFSRLIAACFRHLFAWLGGEDLDPETGLSHLAHAVCCLLFLLELSITKPELDDRYKGDK